MSQIKLLVADDHTLFRRGLIGLLNSEPQFEVIGQAATGDECVQMTLSLKPDVVLMDLSMPGMNGIEATRRIIEVMPQARIVVLTASGDDSDLFTAIQEGVQAYIVKDMDVDELFHVIQMVHAGEAVLSPSVTLRLFETLRKVGHSNSPDAHLTSRELEVLRLLAQGADNRRIAKELSISESTVKSHVSHILDKLNLRSRSQVADYVKRARLIK